MNGPNDINMEMSPALGEFYVLSELPVDLDPALLDYKYERPVGGECILHPLVFAIPYFPWENARLNDLLHHKTAAVRECIAQQDWAGMLLLYEPPCRFLPFRVFMGRMTDPEYWSVFRTLWMYSDDIWEWQDVLADMFDCGRPGRETLMDEAERAALADMPEEITIYRGFYLPGAEYGWSWTTDYAIAIRFAHRFPIGGKVAEATIDKGDVIAYFLGREEQEIVVDPDDIVDITVHDLEVV